MEGEWKQRYDEVLKEMNVEMWTAIHMIWGESRLRKVAVDYGKCWHWMGFQFYSIDQELEDRKAKK